MILILGGTTEGRTAEKVADEAGKPYFYSTKGEWQEIQCKHGIRITGGQGSHMLQSFSEANCLVYLPADVTEAQEGEEVLSYLLP